MARFFEFVPTFLNEVKRGIRDEEISLATRNSIKIRKQCRGEVFSYGNKTESSCSSYVESFDDDQSTLEGEKVFDNEMKETYNLKNKIGEGHFGKVYSCYKENDKDKKIYAIKKKKNLKILEFGRTEGKGVKKEGNILKKIDFINIIKFESQFIYEGEYFLVLEYCERGSLKKIFERRGNVKLSDIKDYFYQALLGVDYLHDVAFVLHRDIKPDNILMGPDGIIKLSDFGLAMRIKSSEDRFYTRGGSNGYMAPEVFFNSKEGYSCDADVFSCGATFYELLTGSLPFKKDASEDSYGFYCCDKIRFTHPNISDEANYLLLRMLDKSEDTRILIVEVLEDDYFEEERIKREY